MQNKIKKAGRQFLTFAVLMALFTGVVAPQSAAASKIRLNKTKLTLKVGKTFRLKVKGTKKKVVWKSSKKKIAKVSKKGVVTAMKKGSAVITAKAAGKKLKCRVTVKKATVKATQAPTETKQPDTPQVPAETKQPDTPQVPAETAVPPEENPTGDGTLTLSYESGYYKNGFNLKMEAAEGYTIYYTTDGSLPDTTSQKYTEPIAIKDRSGDENVLTSKENVKKMCINQNSAYCYVPTKDEVAKATVIRAIAVGPDGTSTDVMTKTYFVGGENLTKRYPEAAVISVVTDPDNLLDYDTGIHVLGKYYDEWKSTDEGKTVIRNKIWHQFVGNYTQKGRDWERPASVEIFDKEDTLSVSQDAGIRLHGGASRMYGQKSFNLYFRKDYTPDSKNLKYNLFPDETGYATDSSINKWKSFILRNGGNDAEYTKFHCAFIQSLVGDRAFMTQKSRPAVLFLNGEYWGVYNLTEKYGDKDIEENFGVDGDNVVVIKEGELDEGEDEDFALYEELLSFAEKDMTDDAVYQEFCEKVDIQSMLDYYATEIYIANNDWPEKNFELWRTRTKEEGNVYGDTKWRYMLFDTEFSMGLYSSEGTSAGFDSFREATESSDADPLFASAIKNKTFRQEFLKTIKEIGSTNFNYETAHKRLYEMQALYEPLIDEHYSRYGYIGNKYWLFYSNTQTIDNFLKERYNKFIPVLEEDLKEYDK